MRRISSSQVRLEIGLQLMSPQVSVVDVVGADAQESRAIFLHSLPAYGKFAGLIIPPRIYRAGERIVIQLPEEYFAMPDSTWDAGDEARVYYKEEGKALRFMNITKTNIFKK